MALKEEEKGKLQEFLVDSLIDIHYAEHVILKGLAKMEEGESRCDFTLFLFGYLNTFVT